MNILIVTDAWHPQVNGVVRTLGHVAREARVLGVDVDVLTPADSGRCRCRAIPRSGWRCRRRATSNGGWNAFGRTRSISRPKVRLAMRCGGCA